jgi:glycosyltransferase involved in cell wall biosynthesis
MGGDPLKTARGLWRAAVPQSVRALAQPLSLRLALFRVRRALANHEPPVQPGPLVVSGLINETKGVSEAARLTMRALSAARYPLVGHDLRTLLNARSTAEAALPVAGAGGVWLIHVNAPEGLKALARLSPTQWLGRYRIGYWAYELPVAPTLWRSASHAFHELWAPSRFVADALKASGVDVPIRVMPHPVAIDERLPTRDRARFLMPRDAFAVLAMGDLHSSATRKNLLGAIAVYRRSFPTPDGKSVLILKTQSSDAHRDFRAQAETAIAGRKDIMLVADTLSRFELRGLLASCDVLLSPHRSEGFGLALAEAFQMDVPALATGWSGNLDFMSDLPELLIDSTLVPVRDLHGVYGRSGLQWAEPDLADAASKLCALANDPALRQRLAAKGRAAVERLSTPWSRRALDATVLGRLVSCEDDRMSMHAWPTQ